MFIFLPPPSLSLSSLLLLNALCCIISGCRTFQPSYNKNICIIYGFYEILFFSLVFDRALVKKINFYINNKRTHEAYMHIHNSIISSLLRFSLHLPLSSLFISKVFLSQSLFRNVFGPLHHATVAMMKSNKFYMYAYELMINLRSLK